jgi:hypothetical protein
MVSHENPLGIGNGVQIAMFPNTTCLRLSPFGIFIGCACGRTRPHSSFLKKEDEKRYYQWIWNTLDAKIRYLLTGQ